MKTKCMSCGGSMKKMQNGGRTISEKAAERKAEKDKGLYVSSTKSYIPYTKAGRKEVKETGGTDVWNMKPTRRVMKKMAVGGTTTKRIIKKSTGGMYGIPQENLGTSGQYGFAKKGGAIKKMQNGGTTKADPYDVSVLNKKFKIKGSNKSGGKTNMGPTKIVPKKVDPKAPKASKTRTIERNGTFEMKTGGSTKATKFAALAPPYNKATFADRIAGAKKKK